MANTSKGCVASAAGPMVDKQPAAESQSVTKEEKKMSVTVGMKAPDFEATAFQDGDFTTIKLSDYAGQWVTLCFYPGDFTFV